MVGIRHALGLAAVAVLFWLLALGPVGSWAPTIGSMVSHLHCGVFGGPFGM